MDGTGFADIPDQLVENTLLRLSVKSLKRCSCVNKSWYSLIQSSSFISRHYVHQSSSNVKLLVKRLFPTGENVVSLLSENTDDKDSSHPSIPFLIRENRADIIGPCINGIICLINFDREFYDLIAFWNFATGEYKILPKLQFSYSRHLAPAFNGLVFGWDPETNEYKVVMAIYFWPNSNYNYDELFDPTNDDCLPDLYVYTLKYKLLEAT